MSEQDKFFECGQKTNRDHDSTSVWELKYLGVITTDKSEILTGMGIFTGDD